MNNSYLVRFAVSTIGKRQFKIKYNCMAPLIRDGDEVVIEPNEQKLNVGDIVVLYCNNSVKCHRIIYIDDSERFLSTKGDNTYQKDDLVRYHNVMGKVSRIITQNNVERVYDSNYLDRWIAGFSRRESICYAKCISSTGEKNRMYRMCFYIERIIKRIFVYISYWKFMCGKNVSVKEREESVL